MGERLLPLLRSRIRRDEDGAVTVDWVVLTAFLVSMGVVAGALVWSKSINITQKIAEFLDARSVN